MTEQIKLLYEKVADKTLNVGVKFIDGTDGYTKKFIGVCNGCVFQFTKKVFQEIQIRDYNYIEKKEHKIIGHPIHIGHCIDWIEKNIPRSSGAGVSQFSPLEEYKANLMIKWKDKTKDIEDPVNKEVLLYMCNLCGVGEK